MTDNNDIDATLETPTPTNRDIGDMSEIDLDIVESVETVSGAVPRELASSTTETALDATVETPTYNPSGPHRAASRRTAHGATHSLPYALAGGGLVIAAIAAWPILFSNQAALSDAIPAMVKQTDAPPPAETPRAESPGADALNKAIAELDAQSAVLKARIKDAERDAVGVELESDTALLMQQIRTARDARRKARPRPKLSAPFSAEELAPAADALRLSASRFVTDRQGHVILPENASLPDGADIKSSRRDADRLSVTLAETESELQVLARACVPYERHCIVEVRTIVLPRLDTQEAKAATAALLATTISPSTAPGGDNHMVAAAPTTTSTENNARDNTLAAVAVFLTLLWSVLTFVLVRRQRVSTLAPLEARLWAAASGTPLTDSVGPRNGVELALSAVEANIHGHSTQRQRNAQNERTTHVIVSALERATRGDFTARADAEDVTDLPIARAVNQMLSRTDDRLAQLLRTSGPDASADSDAAHHNLMRHLGQLAPLADLLNDVGERLNVIANTAGGPPPAELTRLSGQVKKRAEVAGRLVEILKADAAAVAPGTAQATAPLVGVVTSKGPLLELFADNAFTAAA